MKVAFVRILFFYFIIPQTFLTKFLCVFFLFSSIYCLPCTFGDYQNILFIGAVGFVHGAGLQSNVKGTISNELIHVSDWYLTLLSAAAAATAGSSSASSTETTSAPLLELQLKPNERPFIDGDGVANWAAIATGTSPSARTEILIAAQAEGSKLQAQALRSGEKPQQMKKQ